MRLLILSAIIVVGAFRGYAHAAPHHRAKPLAVYDSKGQFVGAVIGSTLSPPFTAPPTGNEGVTPVMRRVGTTLVEFNVNARGTIYYPPIADDILFESTDCTGPPLVLVDANAMVSMAFGGFPGDEDLHYAILPGSSRTWHSDAFIPSGAPCAGTTIGAGRCCIGSSTARGPKNLADTATLDLTALGLVPPFSIQGP
jgi:hypothetical protein